MFVFIYGSENSLFTVFTVLIHHVLMCCCIPSGAPEKIERDAEIKDFHDSLVENKKLSRPKISSFNAILFFLLKIIKT